MNPHGGDIWGASRETGLGLDELIDFSASINPAGPSARARAAFRAAFDDSAAYPDPSSAELVGALSEFYNVAPSNILPANGSTELIHLAPRVFAPTRALIVEPAFSEYRAALRLTGAKIETLELKEADGFTLDTGVLMRAIADKRPEMVFIANPANPTGALTGKDALTELASFCEKRAMVLVVDEAFADFAEEESVKELVGDHKNLIVVRSMTKFFAIAGLRLGFIFAHERTVAKFSKALPPWSVNTPASRAGAASLTDARYIESTRAWLKSERAFLLKGLSSITGLKAYEPGANFIMIKIQNGGPGAKELAGRLLERGLLIRTLGEFAGLGDRFFRVAVRLRADNLKLLKALKAEFKATRKSQEKGRNKKLLHEPSPL